MGLHEKSLFSLFVAVMGMEREKGKEENMGPINGGEGREGGRDGEEIRQVTPVIWENHNSTKTTSLCPDKKSAK